jgi:hypothetical protein
MKTNMLLKIATFALLTIVFMGCKNPRGQILDGPGMVRDSADYLVTGLRDSLVGDQSGVDDTVEDIVLDIGEMPKTAVRQPNPQPPYALYVNWENPSDNGSGWDNIYSVWLANEQAGTVIKVCVTNPMAEAQWERMRGMNSDGIDVPLTQIAAADSVMFAPGDVRKVIVQGCPDGRHVWTYIIDPYKGTALQLPSSSGVISLDPKKKEIFASSYRYEDDGRYVVLKAYSLDGKFLREVGEKTRE